ncbi:metalloregulator ArsR/SmtB family transcription factor [Hyphobacterium sp. SN044]|uniref:ArsR/SmtB family transcription factor n=1 Tax=Hyphobacterium sp. SN044 TaxID=2912575 RepID=UPI001F00D8F8|nr:metalloregulator ArsR/SmtB family transcription factor [Hyphobacterium sp. SN044]MCF8879475.1 metalloregulator ArsR/SmtB family transcription factor [Hyphobacterium sp. SN044]
METLNAIEALGALSQETRLEAFRTLVRHEPEGLPAGEIARHLSVPQNTMSTHLAILVNAGLAVSRREGRSVVYRARLATMEGLVSYLLKDCCQGQACLPTIETTKGQCR